LDYLINHQFVSNTEILRWVVLEKYKDAQKDYGKTSEMVRNLAKKYKKSERKIWDIIIKSKTDD